ncbi:MAG TPA: hypothetical protein VFS21_38255 [Roseiflexaceae bacterium]|nr:hypothetical protein [Roseiflexaceae bacterium]
MAANEKFGKTTTKTAQPKTALNKGKMQPFGAHFVTKLSSVNSKLVCSLSASASTDCISETCA